MTISISKLKADRTGMHNPENWRHDESRHRFIEISGSIFYLDDSVNARGVVATVHAASALIAIAEAALAWHKVFGPDADEEDYKAQDEACDRLAEALKGIAP